MQILLHVYCNLLNTTDFFLKIGAHTPISNNCMQEKK